MIEDCHWGMTVPSGVPQSALELRSSTCDPTSSSQRGFSYSQETKAVTRIGSAGDPRTTSRADSGPALCVQAMAASAPGPKGALTLMPCTGGPEQMWEHTVGPSGFGPLVSAADAADCADMSCGPCGPNKPVQAHACNGRPNQLFRFANGTMHAKSTNTADPGAGYCVAAIAGPTADADPGALGVGPADDGHCAGLDTPGECPYSFYRTSGDAINSFERVHANVHTLVPFLGTPPLSKSGNFDIILDRFLRMNAPRTGLCPACGFRAFLSSVPPHTHCGPCATWCPSLPHADWCL